MWVLPGTAKSRIFAVAPSPGSPCRRLALPGLTGQMALSPEALTPLSRGSSFGAWLHFSTMRPELPFGLLLFVGQLVVRLVTWASYCSWPGHSSSEGLIWLQSSGAHPPSPRECLIVSPSYTQRPGEGLGISCTDATVLLGTCLVLSLCRICWSCRRGIFLCLFCCDCSAHLRPSSICLLQKISGRLASSSSRVRSSWVPRRPCRRTPSCCGPSRAWPVW